VIDAREARHAQVEPVVHEVCKRGLRWCALGQMRSHEPFFRRQVMVVARPRGAKTPTVKVHVVTKPRSKSVAARGVGERPEQTIDAADRRRRTKVLQIHRDDEMVASVAAH